MAKAKPIDEKTIDSPMLWLKASTRTRHNGNFLAATRRWLEQWSSDHPATIKLEKDGPEINSATAIKGVFVRHDHGKIDTSVAIQDLYKIVALAKIERGLSATVEAEAKKSWICTIYGDPTSVNPQVVVFRQAFETEQEARGYCDRYLVNHGASTWYGIIESKTEKTTYRVERLDSFARLNPKPKKPATVTQVKMSAARLSWGMCAPNQKKVHFSHG